MDGQTYKADFVVLRKDHDLRLVVEIDGHDFHEKTRSQVAKDKARERAIVRAGYTVLRFTGSEVVRNPRKCVEEVASVAVRE
jgi:very-short-patch-repair endonuclease